MQDYKLTEEQQDAINQLRKSLQGSLAEGNKLVVRIWGDGSGAVELGGHLAFGEPIALIRMDSFKNEVRCSSKKPKIVVVNKLEEIIYISGAIAIHRSLASDYEDNDFLESLYPIDEYDSVAFEIDTEVCGNFDKIKDLGEDYIFTYAIAEIPLKQFPNESYHEFNTLEELEEALRPPIPTAGVILWPITSDNCWGLIMAAKDDACFTEGMLTLAGQSTHSLCWCAGNTSDLDDFKYARDYYHSGKYHFRYFSSCGDPVLTALAKRSSKPQEFESVNALLESI